MSIVNLIQFVASWEVAACGKGEGRPASAGKGIGLETQKRRAEGEGSEVVAETQEGTAHRRGISQGQCCISKAKTSSKAQQIALGRWCIRVRVVILDGHVATLEHKAAHKQIIAHNPSLKSKKMMIDPFPSQCIIPNNFYRI